MSDANSATKPTTGSAIRLTSIDAYRGFVMFLMMAEAIRSSKVAAALPSNQIWAFIHDCQEHVEWVGCSLHDLIQPSFSFLVGVALPFSIASRRARGQSDVRMTLHAFWRSLLLIALGFYLRIPGDPQSTFEDTLAQIGLGYGFLFMLGFRPTRDQWIAFGLILVGCWAAFALYPLPSQGFDYSAVGVSSDWLSEHGLTGLAAHWNKNSNLAWAFDTWFLNLFPQRETFVFNRGGYATLSFIPTIATMILGLIAGTVLRSERTTWRKVGWFILAGAISMASGLLLEWLGICPIVKRIWTPSWVLFSGGWCFFLLAAFYAVIDVLRLRAWAFPIVVIGMNSIAAYCLADGFGGTIRSGLEEHFSHSIFQVFGPPYAPAVLGAFVLLVQWLILLWMYRRKLFLRI